MPVELKAEVLWLYLSFVCMVARLRVYAKTHVRANSRACELTNLCTKVCACVRARARV